MDRTAIENTIRNFLIEELEIEEYRIQPEARLKDDMGIDSLDIVDIAVLVESNFGFKVKAEEMKSITTFSRFCDYVYEKTNQTSLIG
ncbi:MAG: acyl carrier protein [Candidatus Aphodosoma sp.]